MLKNASDLIRKDCTFIDLEGNKITPEEIANRKNFFKDIFYRLLDGKTVGKTIYFSPNHFDFVVPVLCACWELGANIFVHDFHMGFIKIPEFRNFYNFIDVVVHQDRPVESFDESIPAFGLDLYNPNIQYPDIEYVLDQQIVGDTVAVKTHSSGTTGIPKIINYTHKMLLEINQNFIDVWRYTPDDRPFHWKTLHHSSLFLNYAVPLLSVCKTHYFAEANFLHKDTYTPKHFFNRILPFCKNYKLTRILIPYDWLQAMGTADPIDLEQTLILYCIKSTTKEKLKWILENMNPKEILNGFGCSELGTMFVSRHDKNNIEDYRYNVFTEVAPNLEYRINPITIDARWKGYPWHTLADIFAEENGEITFLGRNFSVWVNGHQVALDPLEKFIGKHFKTSNFQLVGDLKDNSIYLAVFDNTIPVDLTLLNDLISNNLSPDHKLTDVRYFDISSVQSGMKPSNPILLYAFKEGKE